MALFGGLTKVLGFGQQPASFIPPADGLDDETRMRMMAEALGRQGGPGDLGGQKSGVQGLIDLSKGPDPRGGPWTMNAAGAPPMTGKGAGGSQFISVQSLAGAPTLAGAKLMGKAPGNPNAGPPIPGQDSSGLDRYMASTTDAMRQLPTNVTRETRNAIQPKILERGGTGGKILNMLGQMALNYSAGQGNQAALFALQNQEWTRRQNLLNQREDLKDERTLNAPQYFMSGEDRWMYDPKTKAAQRIVNAPQAFEEYANALGYQQGTPEYNRAAQDWVLRASGPTATDNDIELENVRQTNRRGLEGYRQQNRRELRSIPQARVPGPGRAPPAVTPNTVMGGILQKVQNGGQLSPGEQQLFTRWQQGGAGRGGGRGMSGGGAGAGSGGMSPPQKQYKEGDIVPATDGSGGAVQLRGNKWVRIR